MIELSWKSYFLLSVNFRDSTFSLLSKETESVLLCLLMYFKHNYLYIYWSTECLYFCYLCHWVVDQSQKLGDVVHNRTDNTEIYIIQSISYLKSLGQQYIFDEAFTKYNLSYEILSMLLSHSKCFRQSATSLL